MSRPSPTETERYRYPIEISDRDIDTSMHPVVDTIGNRLAGFETVVGAVSVPVRVVVVRSGASTTSTAVFGTCGTREDAGKGSAEASGGPWREHGRARWEESPPWAIAVVDRPAHRHLCRSIDTFPHSIEIFPRGIDASRDRSDPVGTPEGGPPSSPFPRPRRLFPSNTHDSSSARGRIPSGRGRGWLPTWPWRPFRADRFVHRRRVLRASRRRRRCWDPRAMEGQMPAPWAHAALAAVGTAPLLVPVPASPNVVLTAALAVYVGAKRSVKPDPPEESMSKQVRAGTGTRTVPTMDRIQADGRLGDGDDGNRTRCVSR